MAKTREVRESIEDVPELSAKVQAAIDAIRTPFTGYVRSFAALEEKRADLAPKFMKAANLWQAETGGTFVDFVRMLVPDLGETVKEYKAHRAYQAADYLRRKSKERAQAASGEGTAATPQGERPQTPMVVLERLLKALFEKIPEKQQPVLFDVIKEQCNWDDNRIKTLQNRINEVDPLIEIKGKMLDNVKIAAPVLMPEEEAA